MESLARSKRLSLSAMWGEGKREVPQRRIISVILLGRERGEGHSLEREQPKQR